MKNREQVTLLPVLFLFEIRPSAELANALRGLMDYSLSNKFSLMNGSSSKITRMIP